VVVTIDEVARHAGVSKATVSRVLNGVDGHVSKATIQGVRDAIDELGYIPNRLAANLKQNRSMTVGLVVADVTNPFYATAALGVEETLGEMGYSVILANTRNELANEIRQMRVFLESRVDGLIIATPFREGTDDVQRAIERGTRVVVINSALEGTDADSVVVDNEGGAATATRHLIDLGHRRIGLIAGPASTSSGADRTAGFVRAHREIGLEADASLIHEADFTKSGGATAMQRLLDAAARPTALIAANNQMAVGALGVARRLGVSIPTELSFISFDDLDWYELATPQITAVAQPAYDTGVAAARLLLGRLSSPDGAPRVVRLATELVTRESTATAQEGQH
jgi:LacI family transcriptional regulator, galactose operon repressor